MQGSFTGLLTLVAGVVLCFGGHRFFRFLMVVVGFVAGFLLGGSGVAAAMKTAFLGDLGGWIAAIILGLVLAALAFYFYAAAVAVLGGAVAYLAGSGVMSYLGFGNGTLTQAVGIVAGAIAIVVIYVFRVHRLLVMLVTAAAGAGFIIAGILILLGKLTLDVATATDPTELVRSSPLWPLLLLVLVLAGLGAQWSTRPRAAPVPAATPVAPPQAPPPAEPSPGPPPPPPSSAG